MRLPTRELIEDCLRPEVSPACFNLPAYNLPTRYQLESPMICE